MPGFRSRGDSRYGQAHRRIGRRYRRRRGLPKVRVDWLVNTWLIVRIGCPDFDRVQPEREDRYFPSLGWWVGIQSIGVTG